MAPTLAVGTTTLLPRYQMMDHPPDARSKHPSHSMWIELPSPRYFVKSLQTKWPSSQPPHWEKPHLGLDSCLRRGTGRVPGQTLSWHRERAGSQSQEVPTAPGGPGPQEGAQVGDGARLPQEGRACPWESL